MHKEAWLLQLHFSLHLFSPCTTVRILSSCYQLCPQVQSKDKPAMSFSRCTLFFASLIFILSFFSIISSSNCSANVTTRGGRAPRQLSVTYYDKSCPQVEQLVASVTSEQFRESPVSAPATIRLFFHDCFVDVISRFLVTHSLYVHHLHQIAWIPQPRIIFLLQLW